MDAAVWPNTILHVLHTQIAHCVCHCHEQAQDTHNNHCFTIVVHTFTNSRFFVLLSLSLTDVCEAASDRFLLAQAAGDFSDNIAKHFSVQIVGMASGFSFRRGRMPACSFNCIMNRSSKHSVSKCWPQMPWCLVGAIKSSLVVFTKCIHCLLMDPSGGNICMLCPELLLLETPQPDTAHIRPMFDCWQVATVCKWLHRMLLSIYQSLDGKPPY